MGPKVSICVKLGLCALLFGSSISYFRLCEPIIQQTSKCNDTRLNINPSRGADIQTGSTNQPCPPQAQCQLSHRESKPEDIDLDLRRIIYKSDGIELYMSDAYLDDRNNETYLRMFGLQRKDKINVDFKCSWTTVEKGVEIATEVKAKRILVDSSWPTWAPHFAVDFDCKLPHGIKPTVAMLVSADGKHNFKMPVAHTNVQPERGTLGICVKPITGHFSVSRIVEWVELIRLAGVNKIILYNSDIFGTARYVLDYYEKIDVATVVTWPFLLAVLQSVDNQKISPEERYGIYQQTYLLAMHDCLYRFRGKYENLLFIDLDEVLLPTKHRNLIDMTKAMRAQFKMGAGFLFNTAWHFEEHGEIKNESVPDYLYMQRYARATLPCDVQPKSIVSSDRAISLNFHSILDVPRHEYSNEVMSSEDFAYLHHYRGRCDEKFEEWRCKEFLSKLRLDPVMVRYKKDMEVKVKRVLNYINIS